MTTMLPRRRIIFAVTMIVLGLIGGLGGGWLTTYTRAEETAAERDEAVDYAEANCAQLEALGWTCVKDPAELQGAEGPPGPAGPPPTDEQVAAAVEDFFRLNPVEDGESPSPAAIAAAVTNYLAEHPPEQGEPGPAPTAEQIAAAVETYLLANPAPAGPPGPAGADGADGEDGEDGHTPTAEELAAATAAAVEDYIEEHPIPVCPAGSSAEPLTVLTTGGTADIVGCVIQDQEEN
jgi:hypothetical protein